MLECFGVPSSSNSVALVRKSWHDLLLKHVPMAFLKKKRVKFLVDFEVNKLTDVPLLNATLFAKIRLLDGGSSFESFTNHGKVEAHTVILGPKFNFSVRIPSDASTGQLEDCKCKISVRKEDRGGRTPVKIGYVIVNLSEFAASGVNEIKQSYLLDGYTGRQRQDNSRVHICVRMIHQGTDPLFKVPNMAITSLEEAQLNPADRKAPSRTTTASTLDEKDKALVAEPIAVPRTQSVAPSSSSTPIIQSTIERASWHGVTSSTDTTSIASSSATTSNTATSSIIGSLPPPQSSGSPQLSVEMRTTILPSTASGKSAIRRMSDDRLSATINRVQKTRHQNEDVIDEIIAETSIHGRTRTSTNEEDDDNKNGLALFVSKDGEAVVGQNSMYSPPSLQRIHIADASLAGL
jgi:hypothetical protein